VRVGVRLTARLSRTHIALGRTATISGQITRPTVASTRPRPTRRQLPVTPITTGEIARLVHSNGVITVTRQQCSVGRRYAGKQVTARVEPTVLHIFCDGVFLKTIARTTTQEVTQVNAHRRKNPRPVR
jgi:hypothetical protein